MNKKTLFKKGNIPWNKGLKNCYSKETLKLMSEVHKGKKREKISKALKGRKVKKETIEKIRLNTLKQFKNGMPVETKLKISKSLSGSASYLWRGGISNDPYCTSWNILAKEYKQYDNNKCQNPQCENKSKNMTSHHINYNKENCHPDNIITLCRTCNSIANKDRVWWKAYYMEIKRRKNLE